MSPSFVTCTRRIQWCMGHRLINHEGKCRFPHGHNYVGLFEAEAEHLDSVGRVVDFSVLKEEIGGWIEREWDHGFLLNVDDSPMRQAMMVFQGVEYPRMSVVERGLFGRGYCERPKVYSVPFNPTAENIANYLLETICPVLFVDSGITIVRVTIWETENCFATAELSEHDEIETHDNTTETG